jgi:hypothetical protein
MGLRRFIGVLIVVLAWSALTAAGASAAAVTENSQWNVKGAKLAAGASEGVTCKATPRVGQVAGEDNIKFEGNLGDAVVITATGVECLPHNENEARAKIEQVGNSAQDFTRLRFTGLKMDEPPGCTIPAAITTEPIKTEIYMEGNKVYDKYVPTNPGQKWFTLTVTGCTLEGMYKVTGTTFGLFQHVNGAGATVNDLTGEEHGEEMQTFSAAIDAAAGGGLMAGGNPLKFNATIDYALAAVGGGVFGPA